MVVGGDGGSQLPVHHGGAVSGGEDWPTTTHAGQSHG